MKLNHRKEHRDVDRHLTRKQVGDRGLAAFVRHMQHVDAGHAFEQLESQVRAAADAKRGISQLPRLRYRHKMKTHDT